ncbi:MAG TPA: NTP transferase domain-containing protein [Firmicutes bacterium]|nr:NTP transferase domain-containing protein [Bacillota bacterium]
MKVVIMAGGKGTRLRPLTCNMPKPMVPIVNRPIMEHIIRLLVSNGFNDIIVTLCYLPEIIQAYFEDGAGLGANISYVIEEVPLGTAGSVKNVDRQSRLDGTFLVMSGDALTDIDIREAIEFHREKGAIATIVLTRVPTPLEYGVVITDHDGRIRRFLEKPSWSEVFSDTVNTGIYILEPDVLGHFDAGQEFDFSKNLFPVLLKRGDPLFGYVASGYWCDVGTLDQYLQTHYDILAGKARVDIPGEEVREGVFAGDGVDIHPNARIEPPLVIGSGTRVKKNATIEGFTVIGNQNVINEEASIKKSIIWDNTYLGKGIELRGAIVCSRSSIKSKSAIFEGAVIGADCSIGERSIIKPNVKVWPDKTVEAGTTISASLVWGARWSRRLFGTYGVSGLVNVEVTPEFAAKLGAAYGSCLGGGTRPAAIVISSDVHRASRMIKRALISGILASGVSVYDLGRLTTPVTRYAVATLGVKGGLHVRLSPYDPNIILIEFLDEKGINIDKGFERKVENAFFSEDFKRACGDDVGEVAFLPRVVEQYLEGLLKSIDVGAISSRRFKIVASYDPGNLALILPSLFDRFGCDVITAGRPESNGPGYSGRFDVLDVLSSVTRLVVAHGADMGIIVDNNAEKLLLVDEQGNAISDDSFLALFSLVALASGSASKVAVPVTAPRVISDIARQYNGTVVWTKANPRSVMEKVIEEKIFIGEKSLPQFQPVADALVILGKILEFMAREKVKLSDILRRVPRFYVSKCSVDCPWEAKGRVMRTLIEETQHQEVELIDGVKVFHQTGWALILPDSDEPLFHIYSEASTPQDAEALREIYAAKINELRQH